MTDQTYQLAGVFVAVMEHRLRVGKPQLARDGAVIRDIHQLIEAINAGRWPVYETNTGASNDNQNNH